MKIISYLNALTTFGVAWEELRPLDGSPFLLTVNSLKAKYQFQGAGQSIIAAQSGLMTPTLQAGMLQNEKSTIQINQIDFQPMGVLIGSGTTQQTIAIADDLFAFLNTTLKYRKPTERRDRTYNTTIIVDMGPVLGEMFRRWEKVSSLIKSLSPDGVQFSPFGVKFMAFRGGEALADRQFVFERRMPSPPNENWLFSQGPFDTETHVKILEAIHAEFKT